MNDNKSELGGWLVRMAKVESKIELGVSANSAPPIEAQVLVNSSICKRLHYIMYSAVNEIQFGS
jgi:hypothetical protein